MGFWEDIKDVLHAIWDVAKPGFWEVFQFALALVVAYAKDIAEGYLTKDEAREDAVKEVVTHFTNSPEFSENKARLAVEFAVAWYKHFGEANSESILTKSSMPDFMQWYSSRPDKKKG